MDGAGLNGRKLRSIIALLVQLASLADLAAGQVFPIRWLVLAILRRAERAAQTYLVETIQMEWADLEDALKSCAGSAGASPADAALLACRFRWYAAVLGALIEQACALHVWTPGLDGPRWPASHGGPRAAVPGCGELRPYDTS